MRTKTKLRVVSLLILLCLSLSMENIFAQIMRRGEQKRPSKFAGTWYPAQAEDLDRDLSRYLQEAAVHMAKGGLALPAHNNILAIIVPHAGYRFAGQTAAFAYAALKGNKYKRVFLLGPSHYIPFKGVALPTESIFTTPVGDLEIDQQTVNKFLQYPYFQKLKTVFDCEHSLEMQLPWISKTLGKVKLVPLAIGNVNAEEIDQIAKTIKGEITDDDLIIISSDFTHYGPRFEYQPFLNESTDTALQAKIKALDLEAFNCLEKLDCHKLLEFYQRTHDTICGIYPCSILLSILPSNTHASLLNYRTSQDVEKDIDGNSVSYMAIAFSSPRSQAWVPTQKATIFSATDGQALLKIARLVLQDSLTGVKKDPLQYKKFLNPDQIIRLMENRGVFVTLYQRSTSQQHQQLRGCIGYISPKKPLLTAVCENAINAASADPRFSPVALQELDKLSIEVNILTPPTPVDSWQRIQLGQDGIILQKNGHQAVFLPKVAKEFGWDLPQTLTQLAVKAGLPANAWQNDAQFEVFQSQVFSESELF